MYVTVLPSLPLSLLRGPPRGGLGQAAAYAQCFYRYGRDALHVGLERAGLEKGDIVLMPASMCDVVLRAFVHKGILLRLYDRDPALPMARELLSGLTCPRTRAIYVNHDFGVESDLGAIRSFCDEKNLLLIEDCAHLLSGSRARAGRWGDFSIFSPRKLLPLPDGGALRWNRDAPPSPVLGGTRDTGGLLKLLAAHLALKGLLPIATLKSWKGGAEDLLRLAPDFSMTSWEPPSPMSSTSIALADRMDVEGIVTARLQNYQLAHEWALRLGEKGRPLYKEAPSSAAPFSFPLVCEQRDKLVRMAASHGIYLEPTYNPPYRNVPGLLNPDSVFPVSERLARTLVSIPIHQAISPRLMRRLLKLLDKSLRT